MKTWKSEYILSSLLFSTFSLGLMFSFLPAVVCRNLPEYTAAVVGRRSSVSMYRMNRGVLFACGPHVPVDVLCLEIEDCRVDLERFDTVQGIYSAAGVNGIKDIEAESEMQSKKQVPFRLSLPLN